MMSQNGDPWLVLGLAWAFVRDAEHPCNVKMDYIAQRVDDVPSSKWFPIRMCTTDDTVELGEVSAPFEVPANRLPVTCGAGFGCQRCHTLAHRGTLCFVLHIRTYTPTHFLLFSVYVFSSISIYTTTLRKRIVALRGFVPIQWRGKALGSQEEVQWDEVEEDWDSPTQATDRSRSRQTEATLATWSHLKPSKAKSTQNLWYIH